MAESSRDEGIVRGYMEGYNSQGRAAGGFELRPGEADV
jgi:hypothetical protein